MRRPSVTTAARSLAAKHQSESAINRGSASDLSRSVRRLLALVVAVVAVASAGAPSAIGQNPACHVVPDKRAFPTTISLGQTVTVTLSLSGTCPTVEKKADVVLVIDRSGSMAGIGSGPGGGTKLDSAKDAASAFVDEIDVSLVRVAVIAFDFRPEALVSFTDDRSVAKAVIAGITVGGGSSNTSTNIVGALREAHTLATGPDRRPDAAGVVVFLTDGMHTVTSPPLSDIDGVIADVRTADIAVYTIGLGSDAERWLLRRIAGRDSRYYHSPTPAELSGVYIEIAHRIAATLLIDSIEIVDEVPPNMRYVTSSAIPPAYYDAARRTLEWTLYDIPASGELAHYVLEPQETGIHPTNVRAEGDYIDGHGIAGKVTFPIPEVTITAPSENPQCVCRVTERKVPGPVIAAALADPQSVYGWNLLVDEGKPGAPPYPMPAHDDPPNPRRTCLDVVNRGVPWHPLFNSTIWRAGCSLGPPSQ